MANIRLDAALAAIGAGVNIVAQTNTDISAQIIAAQTTLGPAGGKIYIPAGVFYVQNIPLIDGIYYEGAGETITQLKLPNGAVNSMFVAAGDLLSGWGFRNIYFSGIYNSIFFGPNIGGGINLTRSTLNCIDCTAATNVQQGDIENCWFEYFNQAYAGASASGTNYDWYVNFINCRFQFNNIGASFSEHIQARDCYFSFNGTTSGSALNGGAALTGRPNDCKIQSCWFIGNYYGLVPASGTAVYNTQILGCLFATNIVADLVLTSSCVVNGNSFWGASSLANTVAIILFSVGGCNGMVITNNKFNETGGSYQGAIIRFQDNNSISLFCNITISNNYFNLGDSGAGPGIDSSGIQQSASYVRPMTVSGNTVLTNGAQFIKCYLKYQSEVAISGNSFYINGDYVSSNPAALIEMYTVNGNSVIGNTFYATGANNKVNLFGGTAKACSFIGNSLSPQDGATMNLFLSGGIGTIITGSTIQGNNGYKTYNSGTAFFSAATSVSVVHGLANTPNIQDIMLTPQGPIAAPPYVSMVDRNQFIIAFAESTTANISWVVSCNN